MIEALRTAPDFALWLVWFCLFMGTFFAVDKIIVSIRSIRKTSRDFKAYLKNTEKH